MTPQSAQLDIDFNLRLARVLLFFAGLLLLLESLLGFDYALGLELGTLRGMLTGLCLTMAFPLYLVGLFSLRGATASIWLFFIVQWLNHGHAGFHAGVILISPFDWLHGDFTFISAILVSIATWVLCRPQNGKAPVNLGTVFN